VNVSAVLAAVEYGGDWSSGLEDIGVLFNFPAIPGTENWGPQVPWAPFDHGIFAVNRVSLMLLTSAIMLILFFAIALGSPKVVPGKLQAAAEGVIEFVRDKIALEIIGEEGRKFVPLLTGLFVFIFLNNLFKLMPFINFPPTGRIAVPLFLALLVWLVYIGAGIQAQGFFGYFKETLVPPAPKAILPILIPIEFISNLLLRPLTLMVRLFANMVAGHILVVITLITIHAFLVLGPGLPLGIFALVISPLVFGFELFIIGLQAYIFTMLAAVYIGSSVHAAH
jgi:F-type H+-transporting ATPase subunit a